MSGGVTEEDRGCVAQRAGSGELCAPDRTVVFSAALDTQKL